ncbi:hypothetical protein P3G55_21900 [Leptospira sp. 96542]|nr:hypothetical protein [Leptospira sp. 96542]
MKTQPTLPTFGEIVPGEHGRLGAIMRGALVSTKGKKRHPDYAVIVLDLPGIDLPWGEYGKQITGAESLTDGLANTEALLKAQGSASAAERYAAQHIAELRQKHGIPDLYLGARGEMWGLRANVPELFDKVIHWTSTQTSAGYAFVQDFEYGYSYWYGKDYEFRVRALRRIQLQHFNA